MEINEITNLITSVGFPILMCVWFFKWFTSEYKGEQEKTREVMNTLKETINELKVIVEKMNVEDKDE